MRIIGNPVQQALGTYVKQAKQAKAASDTTDAKSDEVSVSQRAAEMLKAREALDKLPEVREDRVEAARARLDAGTEPDAMAVSESILRSVTGSDAGSTISEE